MSHDIRAIIPDFDKDSAFAMLGEYSPQSDDWSRIYDWTKRSAYAAMLSRSAGNPANQLIYMALGVMDHHAGCSGDGSVIEFGRQQLRDGIDILFRFDFGNLVLSRNGFHDLVDGLKGMIPSAVVVGGCQGVDAAREIEFLEKCLFWMDQNGKDSISISFS